MVSVSLFTRRGSSWWENHLHVSKLPRFRFKNRLEIGLSSQGKGQPLALTQVRIRRRKPSKPNLTNQATYRSKMKTLTRATLALWRNIEATQPARKGYYGDSIIAAQQKAYMCLLSTRGKAKLEIE